MTARGAKPSPLESSTDPARGTRTSLDRRTVPGGSVAASWSGRARIPVAGSVARPRANIAKRNSNQCFGASSRASRNTPAKKGRKKPPTVRSEKPRSMSDRAVVTSVDASRPPATGSRQGSDTWLSRPSRRTNAPDANGRRSSARRSSARCASGYGSSDTWKPRSSRNPSTSSVATRPPTAADDSLVR